MDEELVNREYSKYESTLGENVALGGGIFQDVKKSKQEIANQQESITRNKLLSETAEDNTRTMELDVFKYSTDRKKALDENMLNSNWFFDWIDESKSQSRFSKADEDGDKIDVKDTMAASILNTHGLPNDYLALLKSSKSSKGLESRLEWAKSDAEANGLIQKALTAKEQTISSVASSLATPDIVVGIGLPLATVKIASALQKGTQAAKLVGSTSFIAATEFGTEASINLWHMSVDERYEMSNAIADTFIYGSAGTALTRMFTPKNIKEIIDNGLNTEVKLLPAGKETLLLPPPKPKKEMAIDITVEKRQSEIITDDVFYAENKAIANLDIKKTELKDFRKGIVEEVGVRISKIKDNIKSETEWLQKRIEDPSATKGQVKYREKKLSKLQKQLDEANAEMKDINTGHQKSMDELSAKQKQISDSKLASPKQKEVDEMFSHYMAEPKQHIKSLQDFIKTNPDKEYMEAVNKHLEDLRIQFPTEVKQIEDLIKSKSGNTKAIKSEWYNKLSKKNKKILIGSGILGGTVASADDGGGDAASILMLLTLGILGVANRAAIASLFTSKTGVGNVVDGVKNSWTKATDGIINEEGMNNATKARKVAASLADKAYTQVTSTSAPFIKAGGVASEFIQKMLFNKDFGGGAMTMKNEWVRTAIAKYNNQEELSFRAWLSEGGRDIKSIALNQNEMIEFRKLVTDVKEGIVTTESKAVMDMVSLMNTEFKEMLESNKYYGTYGYDKIQFKPSHVPRFWRASLIHEALKTMNDIQIEKFTVALSKAIRGKNARVDAEKLINGWSKYASKSISDTKADVISMLADKNLLKDSEDIDDILDAITGVSDRSNRAKFRIDIDMSVLKEEINNLGFDSFKFDDILDRDSASIMDKMTNQLYATAALSREGIDSMVKLDKMVKDVGNLNIKLGRQAEQIKGLLLGEPIPVDNEFLHAMSNAFKDLTLGGKLQLVVLSTPTEIIQTIFSNGFFKGLSNINEAIKVKFGGGSELARQIANIGSLGKGTELLRLNYAHRGFSNEFIENGDNVYSSFREGTMKFRDLVIYASGLSGMTDILQIANKFAHTEQLARIANGMENGIPIERHTEFGITKLRTDALKPYMKFNEDGVLVSIDMKSMPRNVKDDYNEMLFNMNQSITPETTIGETPLFSKTSSLGRILTTLIAYPLQQFNLHGIQGVKRMDKYSAIQFMGGIGGTYIGLSARNAILDRDMDDETLLKYSMLNAPQGLGLAAIKSMLDPAVPKHNAQLMQMAGM